MGNARDIDKKDYWFFDSKKRYLIFRGVNIGSRTKLPPYLPIFPLHVNKLDQSEKIFENELKKLEPKIDNLKDLGFNVVRLLVMWNALESTPNPNPEILSTKAIQYLSYVKKIIDSLYDRGIYVIIDFHQDVANKRFDGDGFPDWALGSEKNSLLVRLCNFFKSIFDHKIFRNEKWAVQYITNEELKTVLYNFWNNSDKIKSRTHLEKTIGATARFFQSMNNNEGHYGILGYELFNEPHPNKFFPQEMFEKEILPQFYKNAINQIREDYANQPGDTRSFIFVEPRIDSCIKSISADDLSKNPQIQDILEKFIPDSKLDLESIKDKSLVFSFHYYDPLLFVKIPVNIDIRTGEWKSIIKKLCLKAGNNAIPFLTEFGADQEWKKNFDLLGLDIAGEAIERQFEIIEENLLNSTYWNYDFYNSKKNYDNWNKENFSILGPEGELRNKEIISRPYPMRSSSMPIFLRFYRKKKLCIIVFSGKPEDAPTLVYVPNHIHYANGFEVHSTSSEIQFDNQNRLLVCTLDSDLIDHQIILCECGKFDQEDLPTLSKNILEKIKHYKIEFNT